MLYTNACYIQMLVIYKCLLYTNAYYIMKKYVKIIQTIEYLIDEYLNGELALKKFVDLFLYINPFIFL